MKFLLIQQKISKFVTRAVLVEREMNIKKINSLSKNFVMLISNVLQTFFARNQCHINSSKKLYVKNRLQSCWWHHFIGDFMMVTVLCCWWQTMLSETFTVRFKLYRLTQCNLHWIGRVTEYDDFCFELEYDYSAGSVSFERFRCERWNL